MTHDELDRLEALANAATAGPWVYRKAEYGQAHEVWAKAAECETVMDNQNFYPQGVTPADQEFCAAARNAVPALIAEVRLLRKAVELAAYEFRQHGGTVESQTAELLDDARKALEGA